MREAVIKSVKKSDPLSMLCEWDTCRQPFSVMKDFLDHVSIHVDPYVLAYRQKMQTNDNDSLCSCSWLGCNHKSLSDINMFKRHVYFHAFHSKIKSIGLTLLTKNNLDQCLLDPIQRNVIPELPDELACGWQHCMLTLENPEFFYLHAANHCDVYPTGNNVEGGCACQWEGCTAVVKSKHKLKDHMKSHTQEKVVSCPTCGTIFSNMTRFYDHLKRQLDVTDTVHKRQSFECSHCNKKYPSERLLKDHMRRHVNYYQCPFCDMTCPNPSNLRNHFRYRHSNSRPFICSHCTHTSKSQNDLNRHMEIHKSWIHCDIESCKFRCHSLVELNQHSKLVHEMTESETKFRFLCHLCGMTYTKGFNLTAHLRKKHKFRWPPGHVRFKYNYHEDGFYRLQTIRYESIELTQQIFSNEVPVNVQNTHGLASSAILSGQADNNDSPPTGEVVYSVTPSGELRNDAEPPVDGPQTIHYATDANAVHDSNIHAGGTPSAEGHSRNTEIQQTYSHTPLQGDSQSYRTITTMQTVTDPESLSDQPPAYIHKESLGAASTGISDQSLPMYIYDDVVITKDTNSANLSYNLDLLGKVAINDSLKSDVQRAEEASYTSHKGQGSKKRKRNVTSTVVNPDGTKKAKKRQKRLLPKTSETAQNAHLESQLQGQLYSLQDSDARAAETVTKVVKCDGQMNPDGEVPQPVMQTMVLAGGQNIFITSDVPVQFAEPIHITESRKIPDARSNRVQVDSDNSVMKELAQIQRDIRREIMGESCSQVDLGAKSVEHDVKTTTEQTRRHFGGLFGHGSPSPGSHQEHLTPKEQEINTVRKAFGDAHPRGVVDSPRSVGSNKDSRDQGGRFFRPVCEESSQSLDPEIRKELAEAVDDLF